MKNKRKTDSGIALVACVIFLFFATSMLTVSWNRAFSHYTETKSYLAREASAHAMDWAILKRHAQLEGSLNTANRPELSTSSEPETAPTLPPVSVRTEVVFWGSDGLDNDGNGRIDEVGEQAVYAIRGYAESDKVRSGSERVFRVQRSADEITLELIKSREIRWESEE